MLGLYLCSAVFNFIQGWIMTGITQKCATSSEKKSQKNQPHADEILREPYLRRGIVPYHQRCRYVGTGLNQSITTIITSVATLIGVLVMMLSISPLMTLIALVILPISMGLIGFVTKNRRNISVRKEEYLGHINGQVEEVYGGHLVIKAFNREKDTIEEFEKTNDILYDSAWKSTVLSGMMSQS